VQQRLLAKWVSALLASSCSISTSGLGPQYFAIPNSTCMKGSDNPAHQNFYPFSIVTDRKNLPPGLNVPNTETYLIMVRTGEGLRLSVFPGESGSMTGS
jgi:hypothetical protein